MTCGHGMPRGSCFSCDYARADRDERSAQVWLAVLAAAVLALAVGVICAGGCGHYPLAPARAAERAS